ncbi:MAG: RsmD family RNA methyltransferase [Coriobacteriales bacterium]|jgi:16S rRNA (guanine966-N2)-methyltransferase|nr:RsmD family RNA methyltransferase [Coriobacteriales bacterium]
MRIIAGIFKGRTIQAVPGRQCRPTTDRVREAWASSISSILEESCPGGSGEGDGSLNGLNGARVLDAFAGSGALGLELLSRGAESCLFVEKSRAAEAVLRGTIADLRLSSQQARVCRADSLALPPAFCLREARPFDLVVLDPPYAVPESAVSGLLDALSRVGLLTERALISYEHAASGHDARDGLLIVGSSEQARLELVRHRKYGSIAIDYYRYLGSGCV